MVAVRIPFAWKADDDRVHRLRDEPLIARILARVDGIHGDPPLLDILADLADEIRFEQVVLDPQLRQLVIGSRSTAATSFWSWPVAMVVWIRVLAMTVFFLQFKVTRGDATFFVRGHVRPQNTPARSLHLRTGASESAPNPPQRRGRGEVR